MELGQTIDMLYKPKGAPIEVTTGTIVDIQPRYIVVQFKNYRTTFLRYEVELNEGRTQFRLR